MNIRFKPFLGCVLAALQVTTSFLAVPPAASAAAPLSAVLPAWITLTAPAAWDGALPGWFASLSLDAPVDSSPPAASLLPYGFAPPAAPPLSPPAAPIPGLEVTVTAPESVSAGNFYGDAYTVTIRNPCNPITATGLSITATIPASGFTYLEGSASLVSAMSGAIAITDAYTDPLVAWTPLTPFDLNPCDILTLTFRLTTDGDAVSGQRLDVNAVYENPPGDPGRTNGGVNVPVGRGNLFVEKSPSIQDATYGDVIVWTVQVGNTGLGAVYSTTLADNFGAGYTSTNASELAVSPFHLAIGERRTFAVTATVNSCNNLTNTALAAWNIGNEEGDGTAANPVSDTVDVAYLLESPDITLAGNSLVFEYCTPASKTVVVTATNSGGPALDFLLDSNITGSLPFVVGNVDARWSYDAGSGLFTLLENGGVLAAGQQLSLTFVVTPTFDVCTGDGGDGTFHFQAQYDDPCGLHFDGRSTDVDYQYGSGDLPDLAVAKTSSDRYVYTGDTLQFYVDFEAINVQNISGTVVITDNVPAGFAVTGASAAVGIITQTGNLLLWTIPVSGTGDRSGRMTISATVVDDVGLCEAYSARSNTAQASAAVACPTCPPLTASGATEVIIQNTTGMAEPKSMASDFQVCGAIAVSNRYTVTVGDWGGVVFTETLGHDDGVPADDVPPGTLTYQPGSLSVVIDGVDVTAGITLVQTSPQLVLDFGGITLVPTGTRAITIAYSLYISDDVLAGAPEISFFDWSAFAVPGSGSCTNDNTLYQGVDITLRRADLQIDISPDSFVGCETVPVVLTVSDPDLVAEGLVAENIVVTFTVGSPDFGSIDPADFSYGGGFAGNPVTVTVGSNVITWTFQNPLTQTGATSGTITFSMTRSCGGNPLSAGVRFDDRCGVTYSNTDANNDTVEAPDVRLFVTPDTYVVNENVARWRMYLTNVGDGIAGRVLLTDTLGAGLRFISYTTDYPAQVSRLTAPPFDPGEDIVWQVLNLAPGQQVRFDVYADVVGCTDLTSQVSMDSSCLDGACPSSGVDGLTFSRPSVAVRSSNDQTADLPFCDIGEVLLTVKNASVSAHVYQMVITETIHTLIYIPGSARITVTNQSGAPYPGLIDVPFEPVTTVVGGDTILLWSLDNPGLTVTQTNILADRAPEDSIVIRYQLQTDCSSPGANWVQAEAGGIQPCGQFFFRRESAVTLDIDEPEISLTKEGRNVTKGDTAFAATVYAEPGDTLVWRVTANNVFGAYVAQNVVITDTAPLNFQITRAATATIGGGTLITSSSAVTWNLGLLPADGLDRVLLITGAVTSAPDSCQLLTTNRASLEYGCDEGCRAEPIQASANLRTRPSMQVQVADVPQFHRCGGLITLTLTNNGPPAYDVVLTDTLPTGFYYQETVFASTAPSSLPVVGTAAPVWTWSGGISLPTGVTFLTFRVDSGTGGDCSAPTGGSNEVEILYDDILICTVSGPYLGSGSGSVTIVSPTLVVAKTPALQTVGAGQVVTWTIRITNTGAAEAPNVVVTDTLGAGFAEGGRVITWSVGALAAISGTWSATVTATVAASGAQTNSVRASGSCDAGCLYAAAADTAYVTLVDEFVKGPPIQTGTIGSLTVFTFTTTLPDQSAVYRLLTLTDTLPAGLGYVSSMLTYTFGMPGPGATTLISATPAITPGWLQSGAVVWRLGDLDGAAQIDGVITAVIRNVAGNQDGVRRTNQIAMSYIDDGQSYVHTATAAVDILEPNLTLTKDAAPPGGSIVDEGDAITYTIAVTNAAGADVSPAYDLVLWDTLPNWMRAAPPTLLALTIDGSTVPTSSQRYDAVSGLWVITVTPGISLPVGGRLALTYLARVDAGVPSGLALTNDAQASYSSLPGETPDDRDYTTNRDDETHYTPITIGLQVSKWADPAAAANGQTLTFTIRLHNSGDVPLDPVALTDTLPAGLRYAGGAAPAGPDLIDGQRLVWNDVTAGAGLAAGAMQTITFRAVISVGVGITGTLVNQVSGTGSYPGGAITDTGTTSLTVTTPAVNVVKSLAAHNRDAGVVTFTITIANAGPSVLDVIPLHDVYDPYYLGFIAASPAPDAPAADGRLDWVDLTAPPPHGLGADLQPGEQFTVTVAFGILHDITSTTNTAVITGALDIYNNPANDADDAEAVTNVPTAIELLYFRATARFGQVLLEWATAIEIDNYGFYLYRGAGPVYGEASELAFVPAAGHGRSSGAAYSYRDLAIQPEVVYTYWLVDVDTDGWRTVHAPVTAAALPELIDTIYLPIVEKNWGEAR
ncbi:MAG: hypothetical protein ACOYZ7_20170 [Chloroflexota bacterium]